MNSGLRKRAFEQSEQFSGRRLWTHDSYRTSFIASPDRFLEVGAISTHKLANLRSDNRLLSADLTPDAGIRASENAAGFSTSLNLAPADIFKISPDLIQGRGGRGEYSLKVRLIRRPVVVEGSSHQIRFRREKMIETTLEHSRRPADHFD